MKTKFSSRQFAQFYLVFTFQKLPSNRNLWNYSIDEKYTSEVRDVKTFEGIKILSFTSTSRFGYWFMFKRQ